MNAHRKVIPFSLLLLVALLASACAPAATPAPRLQDAERSAAGSQPAAAAPTAAPAANAGVPVAQAGRADVNPSPYQSNRMIIKNGEMNLLVADTDRAIDQVTGIAVDNGGYVVSSKSWTQDELKYASLTMGVPSDQFEATKRRLRAIAVDVLSDTASGQDVSDEYVDQQSRLTNLEATQARIREFLNQAKNVDEALQVNARLTEVEAEIEQVKGRMQYLKDRSAFSTLTINLEPQRPTPTPTPTATPVGWRPEQTFNQAAGTLTGLLRSLGDLLIWLGVVVAPFAVLALIIWAIVVRARRKNVKREA